MHFPYISSYFDVASALLLHKKIDMEKQFRHTVLFLSTDHVFIRAMTIILNRVFKTEVLEQIKDEHELMIKKWDYIPDYIVVDSGTFDINNQKLQLLLRQKFPNSIIAALLSSGTNGIDDVEANNMFEVVIDRKSFSKGFKELLQTHTSRELGSDKSVKENNKIKRDWKVRKKLFGSRLAAIDVSA